MKNSFSKGFKCLKCFVIFYLVVLCLMSVAVGAFASYLLIFRQEGYIPEARAIVNYFLYAPTTLSILSTILGWWAIKIKKTRLLKLFAVLLAVTVIVEISGCVWCFISLPKVNEGTHSVLERHFNSVQKSDLGTDWWHDLQGKMECCGLHGPTDYQLAKSIPFSCCGSDPEDRTTGSCSFLWQKGCSKAVEKQIDTDLIMLSLVAFCIAIFRVPGVFLSCSFAKKMSKETI